MWHYCHQRASLGSNGRLQHWPSLLIECYSLFWRISIGSATQGSNGKPIGGSLDKGDAGFAMPHIPSRSTVADPDWGAGLPEGWLECPAMGRPCGFLIPIKVCNGIHAVLSSAGHNTLSIAAFLMGLQTHGSAGTLGRAALSQDTRTSPLHSTWCCGAASETEQAGKDRMSILELTWHRMLSITILDINGWLYLELQVGLVIDLTNTWR